MKRPRGLIVEDGSQHDDLLARLLIRADHAAAVTDSALGVISPMRRPSSRASLLDAGLPFRPGASLPIELTADPRHADMAAAIISGHPEALEGERWAIVTGVLVRSPVPAAVLRTAQAACASAR